MLAKKKFTSYIYIYSKVSFNLKENIYTVHRSRDCHYSQLDALPIVWSYLLFMAWQLLMGHGLLIIEASRSHSDTPQSVGLLWTSDQPVAETSTWQHAKLTTDRHPWHRQDSNPQLLQESYRRLIRSGHWDRHLKLYGQYFSTSAKKGRVCSCDKLYDPGGRPPPGLPRHALDRELDGSYVQWRRAKFTSPSGIKSQPSGIADRYGVAWSILMRHQPIRRACVTIKGY